MKNSDPIFWPSTDFNESFNRTKQRNYEDSINILQTQWYQADLDQRFALGDQDLWGTLYPQTSTYRRKVFNFNLVNSTLQMISGYQRRNRKSSICIPILPQMQKTADQLTKCLYHINNQSGSYQIISDAFEQGALTQGVGFVSVYMDYTNDPTGEIKTRFIDFKSILIDPYFRKHDLSDCRFMWTRQFFSREEAALLYPEFYDRIMALPMGTYKDDKFYFMPEVYQIQFANLIAFDEYWYLSSREARFLVDVETNEHQEFDGDDEDIRMIQLRFGKNRFRVVKKPRQTVRRAILVNDNVLVDEPNPYGLDCYPFVPFLGYFSPDTAYYAYKFKGVVRDIRDAQYLFNRRKAADLDILESQQQGIKVKKGALITPDDALNRGNGRVLVVNDKMQMTDVEQMAIVPPSPVMLQMEEMLQGIIPRITGVNEELLGSAVDDKAGILSMLRQGAGLTSLQRLFDQCDESQRLLGDIQIKMIQKNWSYNKVRSIIGEEPTPEFDNKAFFKYGCKVVQGVLTESQHQLEFQQLLYLYELTGSNNPVLLNRALGVSTIQEKDKLLEEMAAQQKQQDEQSQKMQQLQMHQMQVDTETKLAYARSQDGLSKERIAKIQTDRAVAEDKLSRAEQEDTASLLNLVKIIKELETMDTTHLISKVNMLKSLHELNFDKEDPENQKTNTTQKIGV